MALAFVTVVQYRERQWGVRMVRIMSTVVILAVQFSLGCAPPSKQAGGGTSSETEPQDETAEDESPLEEGLTWHRDIKPLMETHCVSCHQDGAIGTFSLDTLQSVSLVSEYVADAVEDRRMPPWKAVDGCDDYRDDLSLTQAEIDTIVQWVDEGMAEGSTDDAVDGAPLEVTGLERVDITLELPVAYTPDQEVNDDYRCFPVQWPLEDSAFVTGFVVNPDQTDLVHHVIAYLAPASYGEALLAEEAEDGRPGYPCYGGPGVIDQMDASWLGAWAPGAAQGNFPNGVGVQVDGDSWIILQMHYNMLGGGQGSDKTSVDFQVEDEAERVGWIQPFTNPSWLSGIGMEIPAQTDGVSHSYGLDLGMELVFHSANLHMHTLGRSAGMTVTSPDGEDDCLLQIDDWDFDWQRSYVCSEPKTIEAGSRWSIDCQWDNPTDQDVSWGDGTGDEMCLGSVLISLP